MTMTISSSASAYCTGSQFAQLFDYRSFAQLASDSDVPLASQAALAASTILAAKLKVAAGMIEMACTVSGRYTPADLAALAASSTNSGWSLINLNAWLAAAEMYGRRFEGMPPEIKEKFDQGMAMLAALEKGDAIFGFEEVQQAGIIQDYKETASDVEARNLPSYIARRVFGRRSNRL